MLAALIAFKTIFRHFFDYFQRETLYVEDHIKKFKSLRSRGNRWSQSENRISLGHTHRGFSNGMRMPVINVTKLMYDDRLFYIIFEIETEKK